MGKAKVVFVAASERACKWLLSPQPIENLILKPKWLTGKASNGRRQTRGTRCALSSTKTLEALGATTLDNCGV